MAQYLVIESDAKFYSQIELALKSIDPEANIQHFQSSAQFKTELDSNAVKQTAKPDAATTSFDLALVNLCDEKIGDWRLLTQTIKSQMKPMAPVCLICFDIDLPKLSDFKKLGLYNIIHKPCDELILKETIFMALQNQKMYKSKEIKSQQNSAFAGILKDVELQSISELGFLTLSDALIPNMSLSKYFSTLFDTDKTHSVWAQCLASIPHPQKPGFYINKFQFYYASREFLSHIRKKITALKSHETSNVLWNLNFKPITPKQLRIGLIALHNSDTESLKHEVQSHFKNVTVDFLDLALASKWKQKLDCDIVLNLSSLQHDKIKKYFNDKAQFFWITTENLPDENLKQHALSYREIFKQPYDRSYFYKKLKSHYPELVLTDEPALLNVSCHEVIKAANIIEVLDMNEIYISFNYPRELEYGADRNFILLNENDERSVEIPGFCHFKEKSKNPSQKSEPNSYYHQFAFYSVSNVALKEIRQWLLHNYIIKNQKN